MKRVQSRGEGERERDSRRQSANGKIGRVGSRMGRVVVPNRDNQWTDSRFPSLGGAILHSLAVPVSTGCIRLGANQFSLLILSIICVPVRLSAVRLNMTGCLGQTTIKFITVASFFPLLRPASVVAKTTGERERERVRACPTRSQSIIFSASHCIHLRPRPL